MSSDGATHSQFWRLIDAANGGDSAAKDALIGHACDRLRGLARVMLRDFPRLRGWEQTDDVLQGALLRLRDALDDVEIDSYRHFLNLGATQIRRELIDLQRRYFRPHGQGTHHRPNGCCPAVADGADPLFEIPAAGDDSSEFDRWSDFHLAVDQLPEPLREVFNLLYYHGVPQPEAAEVLLLSLRTVKRRWREAKLALHSALNRES